MKNANRGKKDFFSQRLLPHLSLLSDIRGSLGNNARRIERGEREPIPANFCETKDPTAISVETDSVDRCGARDAKGYCQRNRERTDMYSPVEGHDPTT